MIAGEPLLPQGSLLDRPVRRFGIVGPKHVIEVRTHLVNGQRITRVAHERDEMPSKNFIFRFVDAEGA
jgi:hypothetical protein